MTEQARPVRAPARVYRRRRIGAMAVIAAVVFGGVLAVREATGNNGQPAAQSTGATGAGGSANNGGAAGASKTTVGSPTTTRARRVVSMMFTGDTLIHSPLYNQAKTVGARTGHAFDFNPMFDKVRSIISSADIAICHQETPLTADDKQLSGYPVFSTPHEIVDALKGAGYDGCSTASNHSFDRNEQGITDTIAAFEADGMKQSGMARSAAENATATVYNVNGIAVAHLAYAYGLNGFTLPAGKEWLVRLIDPGKDSPPDQPYTALHILADAKAARAAGADIVVVSIHWGAEYQSKPTDAEVGLASQLLASPDIDLIVGAHPHVVQPIDKIGDKYVIYGVGNFVSNQSPIADPTLPAASQDGVIVGVTFTETSTDGHFVASTVNYTPTWVDRNGYVITPVAAALKDPSTPAASRTALQQSWQRTTSVIDSLGAAAKGVQPTATP